MSHRHDHRAPDTRQSTTSTAGRHRRDVRTYAGLPLPTRRELATICSVPAVLLVVHFVVQPAFDAWVRLKYMRDPVARTVSAHRLAPEPLTSHAWAWHELTRVVHALIHAPSAYHTHVVSNVVLIALTAWALLVTLTVLGQRRWFVFFYWELVVVAPLVGSFAFDLFGETPTGYGASTIGFAFLGIVTIVSALVLATDLRRRLDSRGANRVVRLDGGHTVSPLVAVGFLCAAGVVVANDLVVSSPAMPVHQAGAGFGVLIGTAVVPLSRWF